jgi:ATP-dependent protease HslVU (ClpYQ) ATPase subunit
MTLGWAVISTTGIDLSTVGPTKRHAVVSWLINVRHENITAYTGDDVIERIWKRTVEITANHMRVERVTIEVTDVETPNDQL